MDSYFPKTRRPNIGLLASAKKRPPISRVSPPQAAKIPTTPTKPKDVVLKPVKTKTLITNLDTRTPSKSIDTSAHGTTKDKTVSVAKSDKSAKVTQPLAQDEPELAFKTTALALSETTSSPAKVTTPPVTPKKVRPARPVTPTTPVNARIIRPKNAPPAPRKEKREIQRTSASTIIAKQLPLSPKKITSGPLKGISTTLLDVIRAKEAAAKLISPEQERRRELLGIAPAIVRIVPTIFTVNKKQIMPHDTVVDKCFKGLKSNYTTQTIVECLELLDKVAPEWVSKVEISRGKFIRINNRYTIPQLLDAIKLYKSNC